MTDDAKLRARAAAWMVARGVRSNGSDIITQSLAAEFAAVAAEARREALMQAAAICEATVKLKMRDGSYLPGGMTAHELAARIRALADTPRADAEGDK